MSATHPQHLDIIKRLKRAHGHLHKVMQMLETEQPCVEIAQQLYAVEQAIVQAKRHLIHNHLTDCLTQAQEALSASERKAMEEFKTITKYL